MGKAKASTKKFQKNHLGREITKRKHDQKKKAIREKSLAKYAPKEGESAPQDGDEVEEEEQELVGGGVAAEADVFSTKAKLKPQQSAAHRADRRPAAAAAAGASGYVKPASRKAPSIEDVDVDEFLDGSFLDDDREAQVDQRPLEDDEEGEEDERMDGESEDDNAGDAEDGEDDAALLAEIEAHERELSNLAKSDPDFYAHLQKHDKELLAFSGEALEAQDEADEDDGMDGAEDDEEGEGRDGEKGPEVLGWASLKHLESQVIGPVWSIRALKKLIRVFRSAVHIGEVSGSATNVKNHKQGAKKVSAEAMEEAARKEARFRQEVRIDSSRVYNELVRFVLNNARKIWGHHFAPEAAAAAAAAGKGKKEASSTAPFVPTHLDRHPRWGTLGPILKAFLGHILHFLTTLHGNARMARFALGSNLEALIPFFEPFGKLGQKLLRELLVFWSEGERDVRVDAFLRIRQMAIELSGGAGGKGAGSGESMLELALKGLYLTFVRHSKFVSPLTLPVIEFMANCVVELYGLDSVLSYQHAFVYLRQLALHLRTALMVKKKDAHRAVYNWNFINCLRVWGKVLSAHGGASSASQGANGAQAAQDQLHALVYPFVQVALGTLNVLPSSRYFPLRFHVLTFLLEVCEKCHIFVPLAPHLLTVLSAPELSRKPTSSTRKAIDIHTVLKGSKHVLSTKQYQEDCIAEALHLLLRYFGLYGNSIAFPELALPSLKLLRKAAKESIVIHRVRKQVQALVLKIEHNVSWVTQKRNGAPWAPKDLHERKGGVDGLATFAVDGQGQGAAGKDQSPLGRYVSMELAERRRRALDDSKADWDGSKGSKAQGEGKKKKKQGGKGSDDEDDDSDEEDEAYDRKKAARDAADEMEDEDDMDDEGEDEDEEDDEDDMDEDDDEDDDRPRKKSKSAAAPRPASKPFEYPADIDELGAADGDKLEVFNFDDEDDKPRKQKKGGQQQKKKQAQASASQKKGKQVKKEGQAVKKEGGKAGAAGDKRKRA